MRKKTIIYFTATLIIVSSVLSFSSLNAAPEVNQSAVNYLKTKSDNAWKTMALVAAGESNLSSAHLKNVNSENAIDYCAPTLALTALGQDPRTEPAQDYVAKLKSFWDGTQLGNGSTLNDDIFGLLALISSGEPTTDPIITGLKTYLLSKQNTDGGWALTANGAPDTNMTAAAIMALLEAGVSNSDVAITKAVAYLKSSQNNNAGFPYDPQSPWGTDSDGSSDAWVISAIYKLGQNPETWVKGSSNPIKHLKSLQAESGYFKYQDNSSEDTFSPVTTSYALIALAGKSYPLNKITPIPSIEKFNFRIQGKTATVCQGKAQGPSALDIVKNAANQCAFTYVIQDTDYGPYLKKINNDEAAGLTGWLYLVNNVQAAVGAADYLLKTGDEVLWYFGEWDLKPTKLELSNTEISTGQTIEATVTYFDATWKPLETATVKAGNQSFTTNAQGKVILSLVDGYYNVYAQKTGFVQSADLGLKVGEADSIDVGLLVNIKDNSQGAPDGADNPPAGPGELSFSVDVENINFGDMSPGQTKTQNVTLTNQSQSNLHFGAEVTGASVFQENLFIAQKFWPNFALDLIQAISKNLDITLSIPSSYSSGTGQKQGILTFWAMAME